MVVEPGHHASSIETFAGPGNSTCEMNCRLLRPLELLLELSQCTTFEKESVQTSEKKCDDSMDMKAAQRLLA